MAKHKIFEKQTEIVNEETGEVMSKVIVEKKFVYNIEPDKFYMTFIEFAAPIYKLNSITAKNVLQWMCCNAEFNTGVIFLTAQRIQDMSTELNIPKQSIYNSIVQLKKLELITGGKGNFRLNPEIFWKGDMQTRKKLLESNGNNLSVTFAIAQEEYDSHK